MNDEQNRTEQNRTEQTNDFIYVRQATKTGYIRCINGGVFDASFSKSKDRRGRVQEDGTITPTLTCVGIDFLYKINRDEKMGKKYRIRKLTPLETSRLMGVKDSDYVKMAAVQSNSTLYKQHGNSIAISCLMALFSNLNIKGCKSWDEIRGNFDLYENYIFDTPEVHSK